jgi:membrane-bound lytic murein transglycosylase F
MRPILLAPLAAVLALTACPGADAPPAAVDPIERDLAEIQARDTLVLLTTFNSTSYFIYRGQPMGLELEAVQRFARELEVELRTVVVRDREEIFRRLAAGEGDLAAGRVVPFRDERDRIAFSRPLYTTGAAIVQQDGPLAEGTDFPRQVDSLIEVERSREVRARLITRQEELEGREVHVGRGTAPHVRLVELSDRITGDVQVVAVEGGTRDEALLRAVARGEVELASAHEDVAELSAEYFANLRVEPVIGDSFPVVLAVRDNSPQLLQALNAWLEENQAPVAELYQRYFVDRRGYRARVESEYLTSETGRLSQFDDLLRQAAPEIGWDWRLLAAQAYQESEFNPRARSWAGAEGLMQLMPATARQNGVRDSYDPQQNVAGSVRFTAWLQEYWSDKIVDPEQRLRFVLASYNTGHGHVEDARRLTVKHGGNDQVWSDVAYWLLQKSKREVYTDPVVRYGFSRGLEPVTYVRAILNRWEHYREFVVDGAESVAAAAPTG